MEKDFYTDDFEQLLRDTTEDFRMYPSRKVWHSLYNDLHPAKKWPSFAVSLLLITAILYIGIDNNNAINADADNIVLSTLSPADASAVKQNLSKTTGESASSADFTASPVVAKKENSADDLKLQINDELAIAHSINFPTLPFSEAKVVMMPALTAQVAQVMPQLANAHNQDVHGENTLLSTEAASTRISIQNSTAESNNELTTVASSTNETAGKPSAIPAVTDQPADLETATRVKTEDATTTLVPVANKNAERQAEKAWIENYAFHNARNGNKWKTKFSTLVYITPSVGYRVLNRNNSFEPVNALLIRGSATSVDADDAITEQAAMNLESGATAILDLSRRLRVKAGVQFNYTNYISQAQRLSHPSQTNILLNDLATGNTMLVPASTSYANKAGENSMRLNNSTIQFALPVGADFKVAGNDKIKWYVGATIQPTYVAGGNAYLVSSDYKNYVDMPSMLRTWNLNAGFESFVSYKTKGGSVINLGPQFRYQLLSTYSSRYTYTENLYNVGVKIGITRKF